MSDVNQGCSTCRCVCGLCCARISIDQSFRHKWIYTICLLSSFISLGWVKAQFGPSFLDLLLISNTTLEEGSWFVTVYFIGYVAGSGLSGGLSNFVNQKCVLCAVLLLQAAVHLVIPWCYVFWMMAGSHFLKGMCVGFVDCVACAEVVKLWKEESSQYLMALNILASLGSVISPLITSPFLLEAPSGTTHIEGTNVTQQFADVFIYYNISNTTDIPQYTQTTSSKIKYAYMITACVCVGIASLFIYPICFMRYERMDTTVNKSNKITLKTRVIPRRLQVTSLVIFGLLIAVFAATEEGFIAYLPAFCVEYLDWTKSEAALVMSLMFISLLICRVVLLFVMSHVNTIILNGIFSLLMVLDLLGFALVSIYRYDYGAWLFGAFFGVAKSASFPLILGWFNEYILPVTGKVSSYCMMVGMISSALNPLLLGYLMEEVSKLSFVFLFSAESVAFLFLFLITAVLTRYVSSRYGLTYNTQEAEVVAEEIEDLCHIKSNNCNKC